MQPTTKFIEDIRNLSIVDSIGFTGNGFEMFYYRKKRIKGIKNPTVWTLIKNVAHQHNYKIIDSCMCGNWIKIDLDHISAPQENYQKHDSESLFLTKENIIGVVRALDENLPIDSDEFMYACIVLACNFSWNVQRIMKILGCTQKEVFAVRHGITNANLRKGYLDFLWDEDDENATEEEQYKSVLLKQVEFACITLLIQDKIIRVRKNDSGEWINEAKPANSITSPNLIPKQVPPIETETVNLSENVVHPKPIEIPIEKQQKPFTDISDFFAQLPEQNR